MAKEVYHDPQDIGARGGCTACLDIVRGGAAVEYLGDFCWQVQSNSPDEPPALLQMGVLSYGDNHFPVHGTITGPDRAPVVLHGNAEFTPNLEATLQGSATESTIRQTLTIHLLFEPSLNGIYKLIGFEAPGGGAAESLTDEGIITLVPCE